MTAPGNPPDESINVRQVDRIVDTPSQDRPNRERGLAQKYANSGQITTLMLRNIPSMYTQDMLLEEIVDCMGSSDSFDFFYLPWDLQNDCNVGYAFVNFRDVTSAERCTRIFTNFNFRKFDSRRTCRVYPAHIQGLENNLRHLMDRAVSEAHSHYPIIMWKGEKLKLGKVIAALDGQRMHAPKSAPGKSLDAYNRDAGSATAAHVWPPPQQMQMGGSRHSLSDAISGLLTDADQSPYAGPSTATAGGENAVAGAFASRLRGIMQDGQHLSPPPSSGQPRPAAPPGLAAPPLSAVGGARFPGAVSPEADILQSLPGLKAALTPGSRKVQVAAPLLPPARLPAGAGGLPGWPAAAPAVEDSVAGSAREIGIRDPDMDVLQKFAKKFSG